MSRAALACAAAASVAMNAGAQISGWQCAPTGARELDPVVAEAARDYLRRVEAIYPRQSLGLVRAGERFYLLNSRDLEWKERTRLYLLTLRLQEAAGTRILSPGVDSNVAPVESHARSDPFLMPERQALEGAPGGRPPPGGFVCLAVARAEREGLTRTPRGEIVLAAGQSVHFVDPQEREIAVEVRAAPDRSLNLGGILLRSARAGIYAGLTGQTGQPAGAATIETPDGTLLVRMMASAGESVQETRIDAPARAAVVEPAPAPERPPAVAPVEIAAAPGPGEITARREEAPKPPIVAAIPESAASSAVPPGASPAPAAAPPEVRGPVMIPARVIPAFAGQQPATEQSYDDYARAMRTLLALRRSGAVRSVSEMTYVHPAVEVLRAMKR